MAGIDVYAVAMLHCNGENEGIVFTDESGKTWEATSGPVTYTSDKVFGSASLYVGTTGRLHTPMVADFDVHNIDFTVDFWVKYSSSNGGKWISCLSDAGGGSYRGWYLYHNGYGSVVFHAYDGTGTLTHDKTFALVVSADTWHHIAFVRSSDIYYMYLDGVLKDSYSNATDLYHNSGSVFNIGGDGGVDGYGTDWYLMIDEFRFSSGIARWTVDFTPPITEYTFLPNPVIEETVDFVDLVEYNTPVSTDEVDQSLGLADYTTGGINLFEELLDEIVLTTESIWFILYFNSVEDDINLVDESSWLIIYISNGEELISFADAVTLSFRIDSLADDRFFIWDVPMPGWVCTIADTLTLVDAILVKHGISLDEWIILTENVIGGWNGSDTVQDILFVTDDLVEAIREIALSIADNITTTDSLNLILGLQVIEYLWFADVTPIKEIASILDGTAFSDSALWNWEGLIADALVAVDSTVVDFLTAIGSVAETVNFSDASSDYIELNFTIADVITVADIVASQGNIFSVILEALSFGITLSLDGDVWQCWVISNTEFDTSVFSNFDFNSYCNYQSKSYGVKSDGLYILEGTTDQGTAIHAGVIFTTSNFGTENRKKFRRASLGVSGANAAIRVQTEEGSDRIFLVKDRRAYIDRDIIGKDYVFSISEFDTLDFVDLIPIVMAR